MVVYTSTTNGSTISHILWVKSFSHTPSGVTKFAGKTFSSDLRKLTAVSESLSKSKIIYYVIEKFIWHLHVALEVGIPLCIGVHHAWDRCSSHTLCKKTSTGGEMQKTSWENNGKAVTPQPTRKASLGWKGRKVWLLPWMSAGVSTEEG